MWMWREFGVDVVRLKSRNVAASEGAACLDRRAAHRSIVLESGSAVTPSSLPLLLEVAEA